MVRASRELHRKTSYDEYNISASRDIEYDVPEPPEDDEDPQWLNTGPKYSSDEAGDGPESIDDAKIQPTFAKNSLLLGMGPEFPSDEPSDGPKPGPKYPSDDAGDGPIRSDDLKNKKPLRSVHSSSGQ